MPGLPPRGFLVIAVLCGGPVPAGGLPDFTGIVARASPAVVRVEVSDAVDAASERRVPDDLRHLFEPRRRGDNVPRNGGSGFLISGDGYLVTNHHVVSDARASVIHFADGRQYPARLIGSDVPSDLALMKIDGKGLPYLALAGRDTVTVGNWVLAIGCPFGLDFSVTAGIVSALGRRIPRPGGVYDVPFIQTDAVINPGSSGGPLLDLNGEVVGVSSHIYTPSGGFVGLSFAVPAAVVRDVTSRLKSAPRSPRTGM